MKEFPAGGRGNVLMGSDEGETPPPSAWPTPA